jgi:hypothetical protein
MHLMLDLKGVFLWTALFLAAGMLLLIFFF